MFRSLSYDHHQGSITVLVQLLLIGVRASSYSGLWQYVVGASVSTLYLSLWCLVMYMHASSYSGLWLYVVGASVSTLYLSLWYLVMYIARHRKERYNVRTDAPTTYSHRPEYDEARTPISSNCTSTVINP
jgi:hypothetical protein